MRTVALLSFLAALAASSPIPRSGALVARDPPASDGVSTLDIINKWRGAYGLNALAWDDGLAAQAQQVGIDNGGVGLNHEVPPDAFIAQVMTQGIANDIAGQDTQGLSPFEISYLAGWLCEVASDPQIADVCPAVWSFLNMTYDGTGHHDILTDGQYGTVGCAFTANPAADPSGGNQGLWVCNLSA